MRCAIYSLVGGWTGVDVERYPGASRGLNRAGLLLTTIFVLFLFTSTREGGLGGGVACCMMHYLELQVGIADFINGRCWVST